MKDGWTHIGRLWTNGEPYLAVDSDLRHLWLGFSQVEYFERIVDLEPDEIGITLGQEIAAVLGADGVVRDDSWMEVFESAEGAVAIVQASGEDYRQTVAAALRYTGAPADCSTRINVLSGQLAIFSAACDGAGEHAMKLLPAQAGQTPVEHGAPPQKSTLGYSSPSAAQSTESAPGHTRNLTTQAALPGGCSSQNRCD